MSIIVVEGVDASGKSTLLEHSRQIKGRYFTILRHSCRPLQTSDIGAVLRVLGDALDEIDILIDRHPLISEPIYGPILRKNNLASIWGSERIVEILRKTVRKIVYCRPPREVILKSLSSQPQLRGVQDHIDSLITAYDQRMYQFVRAEIPVIFYDWTSYEGSLEDLLFGEI